MKFPPLSDDDRKRVEKMPELMRECYMWWGRLAGMSVDDFEKRAADVMNKSFENAKE